MLLPCPALLPLLLGITAASQSWPRQERIIIPKEPLNIILDPSQADQSGIIQGSPEYEEGSSTIEVFRNVWPKAAIIQPLRSNRDWDSTFMKNMERNGNIYKDEKRSGVYDDTVMRSMKRSTNEQENEKRSNIREAMIMRNLRSVDNALDYEKRNSLYDATVMRNIKRSSNYQDKNQRSNVLNAMNRIRIRKLDNMLNDPEYEKRNSIYDNTVKRNMKRSNEDLENGIGSNIEDAMMKGNLKTIDNYPKYEKKNHLYDTSVMRSVKRSENNMEDEKIGKIVDDNSWLSARQIFRSLRSGPMITRILKRSENQWVDEKRNQLYDATVLRNMKRGGDSVKQNDIYHDIILRGM